MKKICFLSRSTIALRRGSREEAAVYCIKEEGRVLAPMGFGSLTLELVEGMKEIAKRKKAERALRYARQQRATQETGQGRRNDLTELSMKILSGQSVLDLKAEHPNSIVRYYRGLQHLEDMVSRETIPTWRKMNVTVFWGPTGTGKTRKALELVGKDYYMLCKSRNHHLWWDGYKGQKNLVMDEFRGSWCTYEDLLRILDGHPYHAECKGGHVTAGYDTVYITSNVDPRLWYSAVNLPDQTHLFRRIHNIIYVDTPLYDDIVIEDVRDKPQLSWPIFEAAIKAGKAKMATNVAPATVGSSCSSSDAIIPVATSKCVSGRTFENKVY